MSVKLLSTVWEGKMYTDKKNHNDLFYLHLEKTDEFGCNGN